MRIPRHGRSARADRPSRVARQPDLEVLGRRAHPGRDEPRSHGLRRTRSICWFAGNGRRKRRTRHPSPTRPGPIMQKTPLSRFVPGARLPPARSTPEKPEIAASPGTTATAPADAVAVVVCAVTSGGKRHTSARNGKPRLRKQSEAIRRTRPQVKTKTMRTLKRPQQQLVMTLTARP